MAYTFNISGFATYPAGTLLVYKKGGTITATEGQQYDTLKYAPGVVSSQSRPGFTSYDTLDPAPYMSSPGSTLKPSVETNNNQTNMNYDIPSYVNGVLAPGNYAPGTPTTMGGSNVVQQPVQQPQQPAQQPTPQPVQQPVQQTPQISAQDYQLRMGESIDQYNARIAALRAQQPVQQPIQQPVQQPVQQPQPQMQPVQPQVQPQSVQQAQYINANGAYFQQTPQGLATVNDPITLQGLMSGQIPSTQGGLGSQQLTGMTRPDLIPESARNATPEQGLQYVASVNPELADSIMNSLGYTGSPEGFDAQYGTMAQTNPLEFVQSIYSQLIENFGLNSIKTQFEDYTQKVEELTNQMNDEIADINDNPWLVEGVRIKRIQKAQEKYAGRIDSATASMKYLNGLYSDGLAEARFLTQQTMSIYNDQVDFEQQLYRDALNRAEDRADAQTKMGADIEMALLKESFKTTPSGGGTVTVSSKAVTELKKALNASKFEGPEADGKYANPQLYLDNYLSWINPPNNGSPEEFFKNFPPATYINPKNTWLPDEILRFVKKDTSSSGMTDEEFINELRR